MAAANPVKSKDAALIKGILAGDETSFDALYQLYERRIYFFALKRLGNPSDAEDVAQEVFLQVFRGLDRFEGRSSLLTWMFGIAHNQVCRRFRKRGPSMITMDAPELEAIDSEEPSAERRTEFVRVLRNCSRVLDEKVSDNQQEIFELRYLENRSTREIADELGKSTQAVKISLFRTRRVLSEQNRDLEMLLSA